MTSQPDPKDGPPDQLIAEIVRGFFQGCDASTTRAVTRFQVGQILRQYEVRRAAALRASGAGTRQEEPPWRDLKTVVACARVMWESTEDCPPEEGSAIDIVERWLAESRPNE